MQAPFLYYNCDLFSYVLVLQSTPQSTPSRAHFLFPVGSSGQAGREDLNPAALYPWRQRSSGGLSRVKRDWIIPPIRVLENSKQVPENLVQIKSDKIFTGEVIYKLEGPGVDQDPKNLFEIDDKTGWIRSMIPLDREKYRSFTLKAFALSPSGERLENPSTIEIVVLDQNDNRPNFSQKEFAGSVYEFSVPGTSVMSVTATDADDPTTDNAILSYSIIGQESIPLLRINKTMFGINNETGAIYTRDVGLDWEVVKGFRLKLQVADMSGMGLTSLANAVIHVTDINNNPPRFSPDQYTMSAVENKIDFVIGWVNATDNDEPGTGNWETKYTIAKGNPSRNFAIRTDPVTNEGILSVVKVSYSPSEYRACVHTQSEPEVYTLTLTVENNEAPRFIKDPIEILVPESVDPGTVLASNIAYDPDNAKLKYDILRDPEGWLIINHETGEIAARKPFNVLSPHVKNNIYNAVIRVTDTDAGGISTTASLVITLWETNDFLPQLFPLMGTVCSESGRKTSGLFLTAVDEDLPPHAEPFTFHLQDINVSANWTIIQVNETHAVLRPLVELETGEYAVTVLVTDSGTPSLSAYAQVNVTVCPCGKDGECKTEAAAIFGTRVGVSFIALLVIMASIALLLLLLLLAVAVGNCRRHHMKKGEGLLVGDSDEDIRDNVLNYDEQGGGEEDENAFNIDLLRNPTDVGPLPISYYPPVSGIPRGKQPLRKDYPDNLPSPSYPRKPPADPTDIEDFINDGLEAADHDPNIPPYDTALIYDYEGDGSLAGSLSSIASASSDGDQDYDYLNDWGPRFKKLANMYDPR
uniref:Cadherin domain-containing protein n=1 Tax=Oncorhynchus tshawytscha TaxID=74940 RepID=A0A8C8C9N1_ONCTS